MSQTAQTHVTQGSPDVGAGVLQRKCACGNTASGLSGKCAACEREKNLGLQPKLTIGPSDDPLEREADRAATQIIRGRSGPVSVAGTAPKLSRRSARQPSGQAVAPSSVQRVLAQPGEPLLDSTRAFFEPRFGHDFGRVRIHRDATAADSAREVDAQAYTVGRNVVFGSGQYAPDGRAGRELLAHELAHVVQQGAMTSSPCSGGAHGQLQRRAIHRGDILFEGTCEHLACNSRWACEDEKRGIACPDGTRNAHSETRKKFRPLFTCDTRCENNATCEDIDNWMAIPSARFARSKCGQDLVICANGNFTHGVVRDRSSGEHWEVSPGIIDNLGVPRGTFTGSIYSDEQDSGFLSDSRCRSEDTEHDTPKSQSSESEKQQTSEEADEGGRSSGSSARRVYSLTFDDGPHSARLGNGSNRTEKVLDTLRDKVATAGFFIQTHALSSEGRPLRGSTSVGQQLIRRMHAEGHAIGIHTGGTRDHESHTSAQAAGRLQSELETARSFIRETTAVDGQEGVETTLVRPPFGRSNEAVRQTYQTMGLTNLLWDIDGDPQGEMSLADLKAQVASGIRRLATNSWTVSTPAAPKIVVLYHDIRRNTSTHIGEVMEHIKQVTQDTDGSRAAFERP